ncbi:hypothetical protein AC249_AIPGENE27277 [Exaiptasia diaphana]|nr:hypothetical protein AC249_AIPGENE27277 [Exaiptasia diaphana]
MWRKHDLHTAVIWDSKESILSKMTPIFRAEEDDKMLMPRILSDTSDEKGRCAAEIIATAMCQRADDVLQKLS